MINGIEGFFYLTERVIMCPFPGEESEDSSLIESISDYLNAKHLNQYLVYNLSEYKYDYIYFNSSVSLIS